MVLVILTAAMILILLFSGLMNGLTKKKSDNSKNKSGSDQPPPGDGKTKEASGLGKDLRKKALKNHNFRDSVCTDCGLTGYEIYVEKIDECKGASHSNHSTNSGQLPGSHSVNRQKRLSLSKFIVRHSKSSGLKRVVRNTNSHLLTLRGAVGNQKYGRLVSVKLTGEAIVAFKMASQLLRQNQMRT